MKIMYVLLVVFAISITSCISTKPEGCSGSHSQGRVPGKFKA